MVPARDLSTVPEAVLRAVRHIIKIEGGYVNDSSDKGGATNHGVSLRYAKGIGLDINGDKKVDEADIRLVTPEIAEQLFLEDFFYAPHFDLLPPEVHLFQFDFAVNSGAARAAIEIQDVINLVREAAPDLGLDYLKPDGLIGRKTAAAAAICQKEMGAFFVNALCDNRIAFLESVCVNDPSQRRFIKGWRSRVNSYRVEV